MKQQIHVYVEVEMLERLDACLPSNRERSKWVVQAIRERLDREEQQTRIDDLAARVRALEKGGKT